MQAEGRREKSGLRWEYALLLEIMELLWVYDVLQNTGSL